MTGSKKLGIFQKGIYFVLKKIDSPHLWEKMYHAVDIGHPLEALSAVHCALACDKSEMDPYGKDFQDAVQTALSCQEKLPDEHLGLKDELAALLEKHNHHDFWGIAFNEVNGKKYPTLKAMYAARWALGLSEAGLTLLNPDFDQAVLAALEWQHALADENAKLKEEIADLLKRYDKDSFWKKAYAVTDAEKQPALKALFVAQWALACYREEMPELDETFYEAFAVAIKLQHALSDKHQEIKKDLGDLLETRNDPALWDIAYSNTSARDFPNLKAIYATRRALCYADANMAINCEAPQQAVKNAVRCLPALLMHKGEEGKSNRKLATRLIRFIKSSNNIGISKAARDGAFSIPQDQKQKEGWAFFFLANNLFVTEKKRYEDRMTALSQATDFISVKAIRIQEPTRREIFRLLKPLRTVSPKAE